MVVVFVITYGYSCVKTIIIMKQSLNKIKNLQLFLEQEEDKFYTYLHYTKDTNIVFYVGKGKNDRCLHTEDRSTWWQNVVNKHDYYIVIESINLSEDEAFKREIELIAKFGRKQYGGTLVNLSDGGEGVSGRIWTENERNALSVYMKQHPEYWEHLPRHTFGKDNPNYGNRGASNPLSKSVLKLDLDGNVLTKYECTTLAAEAENTKASAICAVCLGKRHQLKGFKYVYEEDYHKGNYEIKLGPTNKRPVYQLDPLTLEIIKEYPGCADTKQDGFNPTNVGQVCLGKKKTHKGYKWIYKSDYKN